MTVTAAKKGQGAQFAIGDGNGGGSTVYTKVGEVKSINGIALTREALDATHLESPDDYREYIPGLMDGDPVSITFNYVPNASDPLYTAFHAGSGDFQITYPGGIKMQFQGIPTNWKPGDATSDVMVGEMTVKPSGKPTLS